MSDDEYGMDIELTAELETLLDAVGESQFQSQAGQGGNLATPSTTTASSSLDATRNEGSQHQDERQDQDEDQEVMDIEDLPMVIESRSPFEMFRKKGFLSVSDLVGTVWCEVQYDYRLRTLPYLPPSERPDVITSREGKAIAVDKVKVEGKERILKRGEKIHKRLEREIHPQEIIVVPTTREDVWGLRFLNMLSALEALITLGKCRELPVVGFVGDVLIMGIIDEITREAIEMEKDTRKSSRIRRSQSATTPTISTQTQTSLMSFFSPTRSASQSTATPKTKEPTHRIYVSDSKTRASGSLPRESDTLAGKLQVMMYKELLDAMLLSSSFPTPNGSLMDVEPVSTPGNSSETSLLPTGTTFTFTKVFDHLHLDSAAPFSESFLVQARPIILGNGLDYGSQEARCLDDMVEVWGRYVDRLGLGTPLPINADAVDGKDKGKAKGASYERNGKTEDKLQLVYRRAGKREKRKQRNKTKKNQSEDKEKVDVIDVDDEPETTEEDRLIQLAIERSLQPSTPLPPASMSDGVVAATQAPDELSHATSLTPFSRTATPTQLSKSSSEARRDGQTPSDEEREREEDELAWAVEMSLADPVEALTQNQGEEVVVRASQGHPTTPAKSDNPVTTISSPASPSAITSTGSASASGSIIGHSTFTHSPSLLATHLEHVLGWWMGRRQPEGVTVEETRRCGWCEFEEGCEWRAKKAKEVLERVKQRKQGEG